MVDVDGVLIVHPDAAGWSANLERDLGIAPSQLQTAFFKHHWDDVVHGRASIHERLTHTLRDIAPAVSAEQLIEYWFRNDAHVDHALMAVLATFRAAGLQVHLATVQDHARARYLWDDLDFRSSFDGLHYAAELGCSKPDLSFYESIERRTGFRAQDIFFIDDKHANVDAAIARGWNAAVWTGKDSLRSLMSFAHDLGSAVAHDR